MKWQIKFEKELSDTKFLISTETDIKCTMQRQKYKLESTKWYTYHYRLSTVKYDQLISITKKTKKVFKLQK